MNDPSLVAAITPVAATLEDLDVPYYIGGSVASSAYGLPRTTMDVDLVAAVHEAHIDPLVQALQPEFYIDGEMIRDAVQHASTFNLIHFQTILKVDVFLPKPRAYDAASLARRRRDTLSAAPDARAFYLTSPEDVILNKLEWFRAGGQVSERQWLDVLGVLKVRGPLLDLTYLRYWAADLGISDLLVQAFEEAGVGAD